jgi:enamine deaminase RidA (YjgF/YER057c/UK114 family)
MQQNQTDNYRYYGFNHGGVWEYFIHHLCRSEEEIAGTVAELAAYLKEKQAVAVNVRVFVKMPLYSYVKAVCQSFFDSLCCPVSWFSQADKPGIPAVSFQVHAIAGVCIDPITDKDRAVGCRLRDEHAEYYYLQALSTPESAQKVDLTRGVFDALQGTLQSAGIDFSKTVRTWLFADDILSWYDQLNRGRDRFFEQHDVFNQLIPASTGVGIANPFGASLATELLAIRPLNGAVGIYKVSSPLQCEALDYKSSFSRAVRIQTPDHARLYVSGTASIAPDGTTSHVGDCARQIELTMQVVEALIANGSMEWSDSVRAIAYFKDSRDFGLFDAYCLKTGIDLPHVKVEADVCRDDLLFELELELLSLL